MIIIEKEDRDNYTNQIKTKIKTDQINQLVYNKSPQSFKTNVYS